MLTWRAVPPAVVLMNAALLAALWPGTRPIEVNAGFGYDGTQYAAMVSWLRGAPVETPQPPYAYRALPAALVAATGLDVRVAFFALNVAAIVGSALLLASMLRAEGARAGHALVLLGWYALLPNGLRYALAYPVLMDGIGLALFVLLLVAVQRGHGALVAAALLAGSLSREHIVLFAPLAAAGAARRVARVAAVALPALAAMALIRLVPPYPVSGPSAVDYLVTNAAMIALSEDAERLRLAAAPLLTFGVLGSAAIALSAVRLRTLPAWTWTFTLVVVLVSGTFGGLDHDRYFVWLAPLFVLLAARARWPAAHVLALTLLHVVATRVYVPLDGSARSYLDFVVKSMPLDDLARWAAVCGGAMFLSAVLMRRGVRSATTP